MPKTMETPNPRGDAERRRRQASRLVRILQVHKRTNCVERPVTEAMAAKIGKELGVTARTIYRDVATLDLLYETLGSRLLDK